MITVTFTSADQAKFVLDLIRPGAASEDAVVGATTLALSDDALGLLGELDEETDGHFDGEHVWIGGSEYPVERHSRLGRPRIGPALKIRVPNADLDALTERARTFGVDRSALIRQYIRDGLAADVVGESTTSAPDRHV